MLALNANIPLKKHRDRVPGDVLDWTTAWLPFLLATVSLVWSLIGTLRDRFLTCLRIRPSRATGVGFQMSLRAHWFCKPFHLFASICLHPPPPPPSLSSRAMHLVDTMHTYFAYCCPPTQKPPLRIGPARWFHFVSRSPGHQLAWCVSGVTFFFFFFFFLSHPYIM